MNKGIIKAVVLLLVFCGTLTVLCLFPRTEKVNLTSEMGEATLPSVYLKSNDMTINQLYGYKGGMDPLSVRDTITPLADDLRLPVSIQTYKKSVDTISYAVRTLDTERLLEEKQISNYSEKNGVIETELQIQNLLDPGSEYLLELTLESKGEKIVYYTRIIRPVDSYVEEALAFAMDFHEKTFDKDNASQLATYLNPNTEGDNTTLQKVTINSSLGQVTWGNFNGKRMEAPVPSVKEINSYYCTIVLNYVMASTGKGGELEYFNVEEYFRVRHGGAGSRIFLLNYQRTMNEIFRGNEISQTEIQLGIRDEDTHFKKNENETAVCFVQEGELWSYKTSSGQLSYVYGFRKLEGMNERENNPNHDIRIINVDENGNIDFVLFGYMSRGEHEGEVGIGVYHYDSMANTVEEELFVKGDKSYQILKEDWGKLFYISDEGIFYMIADHRLYRIDMKAETETKAKQLFELHDDNYVVSEDGRYIAWRKKSDSHVLNIIDLESEEENQITTDDGEHLMPIGFVNEDFVYGIARDEDKTDNLFPMYKIVIVDKTQKILKEYEKLFASAYVEDTTIHYERVIKNGDSYVPAASDAIRSHITELEQNIKLNKWVTEDKQTQVRFVSTQNFLAKRPQVLTPKEIVQEKDHQIELKSEHEIDCYNVYAGGKVIRCTASISEAIQYAQESAGVVINANQDYIWSRGKKSSISFGDKAILGDSDFTKITSAAGRSMAALLQIGSMSRDIEALIERGKTPLEIMEEVMPEAEILDLTGCNLEQVLYYVNRKSAVYAIGENKEPLLIVGYDEYNTILYNPNTNQIFKKGLKDSISYFENEGNMFYSYINKEGAK